MECSASIIAGFVVFSIIGHMSFIQQKSVEKVAESGPGLTFLVYPEGAALMPFPSFWAAIFFAMIVLLGFGSEVTSFQGFITALEDEWPNIFKKKRELAILFWCSISFLIGLPMVTQV